MARLFTLVGLFSYEPIVYVPPSWFVYIFLVLFIIFFFCLYFSGYLPTNNSNKLDEHLDNRILLYTQSRKSESKILIKNYKRSNGFFYIERGKRTLRSFIFIIFKRNFYAYRLLISSRIVLRMNTLQASKSEFLARTNPPYFLDELIFFTLAQIVAFFSKGKRKGA